MIDDEKIREATEYLRLTHTNVVEEDVMWVDTILARPNLGMATTKELLQELQTRMFMECFVENITPAEMANAYYMRIHLENWMKSISQRQLNYRTVDS